VSDALNYCVSGGVLVGPDRKLGPEPFDYCWPLADAPIGCNHLVCRECGKTVRSANRVSSGPQMMARWQEVFPSTDWDALIREGVLERSDYHRLYVCAHTQLSETNDRFIEYEESWQVIAPPPPWRCAGHPRIPLPGALDGIALALDSDFDALAERALSGRLAREVPATAPFGDQWLSRLFHLIKHNELGGRLARAVFGQISSPDLAVRVQAIDFFRRNPNAPGAEDLVALARDHRERFAGVANPNAPDTDLLYFVLQALACRVDEGDRAPLALLHDELLKPGPKPGYLIATLERHDAEWLAANRTAILSANLQLAHLFS
jgi:hypothetical protein